MNTQVASSPPYIVGVPIGQGQRGDISACHVGTWKGQKAHLVVRRQQLVGIGSLAWTPSHLQEKQLMNKGPNEPSERE